MNISQIKDVFDKSRQELLDMGLRGNTLLSLGKGAKVLEIVDERSCQVYETLVDKHKAMKFLPAPSELEEDEAPLTLTDLTQHLESSNGGKRHQDNALQTQLFTRALDTRLLKIHSEALTFVQEQGMDILYMATGFLKWYEDQNSDKARYAPLVLIPVELFRGEAGEAFKLNYTDAELGTNLTLASKLKMDFGIELPVFSEEQEEFELEHYFSEVEKAISREPRWEVARDKIALSFFSFGKFQMYQDLAEEVWPEGKKPSQNAIIEKLFGGGFESDSKLLSETPMDVNKAEAIQLVLDSDSSQTEAVLAAKSGVNLVIQGPPGTGKSQTITNIISQALADDKKILFVAEKMAALDVVKRRLDNCNIGDAVLELHSHKANKKSVLSSLESTLLQASPVTPQRTEDIEQLVALRARLDAYTMAVNSPIKETGMTYQVALGHVMRSEDKLAGLDKTCLPKVTQPVTSWTHSQYGKSLGHVQELVDYLSEHGAPINNLYQSTRLTEFSPAKHSQSTALVKDLVAIQQQLVDEVGQLSEEADLVIQVTSYQSALQAFDSLKQIANKPELMGVNVSKDLWLERGERIIELAKLGARLQTNKNGLEQEFTSQAFEHDWTLARGVFATTGKKWWRLLSSDFRRCKATFAGLRKNGLSGDIDQWIASIDAIQTLKSEQKNFIDSAQHAIEAVGDNFTKHNTDWQSLLEPLLWVQSTYQGIEEQRLDPNLMRYLERQEFSISEELLSSLRSRIETRDESLSQVSDELALDSIDFTNMASSLSSLARIESDLDDLYELVRFNRISDKLSIQGLDAWGVMARAWTQEPKHLSEAFVYQYHSQLVSEVYEQELAIKEFDRVEHEKSIERFRSIDKRLFGFAQEELVEELYSRLPNPSARGEVETLRREFNKKRRHLPIRRLLNTAGRAIQQIKPVFMMSPMSIATYLEPGSMEFDLVIFDEASQVKVADGLGAILRGKQVIVVGDTKQMPPTNFFGRQFTLDDEEAELSLTADIESILGMFLASGTPERMLKWHYRSRHESLIAVSNQEFYDNKLMIFPSSGINPSAKGLSLSHLPETSYDRGGSRTNSGEATAVAEAVMEHAKQTPNQTLGVVAFSTAQRDAILLEVERLRKENPDLEHFFAEHPEGEDFFVKNLENVQGDERDTIYISIGYGKTPEGRLSMSFGPLNSEGGERRLNVLITRSRLSMQVFSNFKAEEMPTTGETPFGVRALKHFLHYADSRELIRPTETGKEPDSPFEEEVIATIRGLGYEVQPQVGCAGFYIDIAVRDPSRPGRYMLAVECDGATYHSSKSARDRDRIRQGVLEGLGWRFHRIWSTDWFRSRYKESERLKEVLLEAKAFYKNFDEQAFQSQQSKAKPQAQIDRIEVEHEQGAASYQVLDINDLWLKSGEVIPDVARHHLATDIQKIVEFEGPIHIKHLGIRLLSAVGATRSGARISRAILQATAMAEQNGWVKLEGEFLISPNKAITARSRQDLPANERKFDFIFDGEIGKAALDTVEETYSIAKEELVKSVAEVLGFSSTSKGMKLRIESVLAELEESDALDISGGVYRSQA